MRYASILSAFYSTPLAILPAKLEQIRAFLRAKSGEGDVVEGFVTPVELFGGARRSDGVQIAGKVAIMPVFGAISQRVGMMARSSGGVSTEEVGATLQSLVDDKAIRSVVMVFDSPGGSVYGVQELADKMRSLGAQKKIVGIADSMAASAAYWLLSQCAEVNVTPGGQVGSIGVLCAHEDHSEADKLAGVKTTYITSAPYKVEGAPEMPLGEEARGEMQAKVNHYHGVFTKAVARGRNVSEAHVTANYGGGRMLTAKDAVAAGMADRVATLEQVLSRLGAEGGTTGMSASRVFVEMAMMEIDE